eukprot:scaffold216223_cov40-Tisochrysis_lutea.AAC.1
MAIIRDDFVSWMVGKTNTKVVELADDICSWLCALVHKPWRSARSCNAMEAILARLYSERTRPARTLLCEVAFGILCGAKIAKNSPNRMVGCSTVLGTPAETSWSVVELVSTGILREEIGRGGGGELTPLSPSPPIRSPFFPLSPDVRRGNSRALRFSAACPSLYAEAPPPERRTYSAQPVASAVTHYGGAEGTSLNGQWANGSLNLNLNKRTSSVVVVMTHDVYV